MFSSLERNRLNPHSKPSLFNIPNLLPKDGKIEWQSKENKHEGMKKKPIKQVKTSVKVSCIFIF